MAEDAETRARELAEAARGDTEKTTHAREDEPGWNGAVHATRGTVARCRTH